MKSPNLRRLTLAVCCSLVSLALLPSLPRANADDVKPGPIGVAGKGGILLHNGWKITPAGTHHEMLGDTLLGAALSPDGKTLAVTSGGGSAHSLSLIDTATGKAIQTLPVPRAQSTGGVAWSPDGATVYVAGGNSGRVFIFHRKPDGQVEAAAPLAIPDLTTSVSRDAQNDPAKSAGKDPTKDQFVENAYLSGLTIAPDGKTLYAANLGSDTLYVLDAATGAVQKERHLTEGDRPGVLRLSPDGKTLYAALWAKATVLVLDPTTLERRSSIAVGRHPNDALLSADGTRLYVSCGNDDAVFVVDTAKGTVSEKIDLRLTPHAPAGATPSALALTPDNKTLFVACSDDNAVAVVDVAQPGRSRVAGMIPTAFYPTLVSVSSDGHRLFVGNGKGMGTGANNRTDGKPIDPVAPQGYPYIVALLQGVVSTVEMPDAKQLAAYTRQVYANSPYKDALLDSPAHAPKPGASAIPSRPGDPSPIKHILYIIKENRTYDQVLGDLKDASGKPMGNGDPNLALFGENVTPNHHELAREFVTLDNIYCNGEVSVDGHHWSNGAYVPDFMQRTWPSQYGGKGTPPLTDDLAATPSGRIWDLCERAKVSYRTYYYHTKVHQNEDWAAARARGERDYQAVDIYLKDLKEFEQTGQMPQFMIMALSEDHTRGTTPRAFTPRAAVASNDQGIGKIVEALSHSKFWKETAVFIIEDDAQNGPDHVDAHRTVALVASPYTRRRGVDSTFYTTVSLLRTMELILGLPPMSPFDAAATPLYNSFRNTPDLTPYTNQGAKIALDTKNPARGIGAEASARIDFSEPDLLTVEQEDTLNRVLWHSIRGESVPYPATVRRPLFTAMGLPTVGAAKGALDKDDDD